VGERHSKGPVPPTAPGPEVNVIPDSTTASIPPAARVVDLDLQRHWRRLRLTATVPVPCEGVCRCYSVELGGHDQKTAAS
jgi:hypothetical protein